MSGMIAILCSPSPNKLEVVVCGGVGVPISRAFTGVGPGRSERTKACPTNTEAAKAARGSPSYIYPMLLLLVEFINLTASDGDGACPWRSRRKWRDVGAQPRKLQAAFLRRQIKLCSSHGQPTSTRAVDVCANQSYDPFTPHQSIYGNPSSHYGLLLPGFVKRMPLPLYSSNTGPCLDS